MKVSELKTNRMENPLGFLMESVRFSYVVEESRGTKQTAARIQVSENEEFTLPVFDSGRSQEIDSICYEPAFVPQPRTRYYWKVTVWDDAGDCAESEAAWFETAKGQGETWKGYFITQTFPQTVHPVLYKDIEIKKPLKRARLYALGLGVYELYLNGEKVGDEVLLPGLHAYDSWLQYQTFELQPQPGVCRLEAWLGEGWYKGPFGLKSRLPRHGEEYAFIAELHLLYEDGTGEVIGTDDSWRAAKGKVTYDSIYHGEIYDETAGDDVEYPVRRAAPDTSLLTARLSPPIRIMQRLKPAELLTTPAGERVLDMGQNMVGWLEFRSSLPAGGRVELQFGEILQDGCFYRDNLRTAKCEYAYVSDGVDRMVRAHFTFYGFRYVRLQGFPEDLCAEDFTGCVIHSQMEETGELRTSDERVNRLIQNVFWGQRGNFLDVPTDCPQRDERMGWTGDAQIFADTASFNMDTYAFYTKYMKDLALEQEACGGSVPYVVPMSRYELGGACAWGDAATIIPWMVWLHYGDPAILKAQYSSMKAWVEYIHGEARKDGDGRLWKRGRHFGDWLALDGKVDGGVYGSTDPYFLSSAYYFYSALLTSKAAGVLGMEDDRIYYERLSEDVRAAFYKEYYTCAGRLAVDTQTAYAVVTAFGLVPAEYAQRIRQDFREKLKQNAFKLNTGFVGTPYLCPALADSGFVDLAYELLLNREYPGWLYEVDMGATTIWERWNSVLPDGHISGTGMNSLNHYAYGSIAGFLYRYMAGINPTEQAPGFRRAVLAPKPDYRLRYAQGSLKTPAGYYRSGWELTADWEVKITMEVPFGACAEAVLPRAAGVSVRSSRGNTMEGTSSMECFAPDLIVRGDDVILTLQPGCYCFLYTPNQVYRRKFGMDSNLNELMGIPEAREIIVRHFPKAATGIAFQGEGTIVEEIARSPFAEVSDEALARLKEELEALVL